MGTVKSSYRFGSKIFQFVVLGGSTFLLFQFVSLYLSWPKQAVLGGMTLLIAILLNKSGKGHAVSLALMLLSLAATLRYGWWRIHLVINFFTEESNKRISIDSLLMLILLSAEAYTFVIMVLGYMQTSFILRRKPVPLPANEEFWPHVDVLIPTYNEHLSLVRYTALAAINIDYPPEKLHVYILDDGTREDFRQFALEAGVGYLTRKKHNHAKAGNINHALTQMHSPLVAIFDCDHVPTRSFLQFTAGWFLVDPRLAMLQTPHYFYSPDPFERNLLQYKSIPNEGELFYGIIQDGNDFWNATFFCGSCAVIRRSALDEVNGIATETVTEDAHTSLRMQSRGWNTAYINVPQAAGLATETLAGHVGQRVRWARGMIQILRTNNPLLATGMKFTQRLCYFNAMLHFMYAVPRMVFLLAPLAYMLFGRTVIPGYWIVILVYALPHLAISSLTNSRIQGRHRHSFWNEIYETVLAPYILLPTLLALINPKLGSFNVTDKGTTLDQTRFDRKIALPTTWMLIFNFVGILVAPYRLFVLDPQHPGVIISNLFWIFFNMVILGVAAAVAHEQRQRRASVRIPANIPIIVQLPNGRHISGHTNDMSVGGASIVLLEPGLVLKSGEVILVAFPAQTGEAQITSSVIGVKSDEVRLQFNALTLAEQETLTRALYSRADSWIHGREDIEDDRPMVSLGRIVVLSFTGFKQVFLGLFPQKQSVAAQQAAKSVAMLLVFVSFLAVLGVSAETAVLTPPPYRPLPSSFAETPGEGLVHSSITLRAMGVEGAAQMRGPRSFYTVRFVLPLTQIPRRATLKLSYQFSRSLQAQSGSIIVRLNDTLLGEVLSPAAPLQEGEFAVTDLPISADILVRNNDLTFEFKGGGVMQTQEAAKSLILGSVGDSSSIEISSDPIALRNDVSLLPMPFYDNALQTSTMIPFVFLAPPDSKMLQAAGIVASWFGLRPGSSPVRFSASIGHIPPGNVVIFLNQNSGISTLLQIPANGPTIAIKSNPSDPNGSALILSGQSDDQLIQVAQALTQLNRSSPEASAIPAPLLGDTLQTPGFSLPAPRLPADAPRWLPSGRLTTLDNGPLTPMRGDGSKPIPIYFHIAPDLYFGENENLRLMISYQYNGRSISVGSALRVYINGLLINEVPLPPGSESSTGLRRAILPVADLRPFGNTLLFNFDFNPALPQSEDQSAASQLQGEILKTSAIDLRGLDHWAKMPNLELFANAGFPFTKWADLSRTIVLLPGHPSTFEIALFLNLMSHCGTQTGYPALRMEIAGPNDVVRKDRDYLILGTLADQPAFDTLQASLPVPFSVDGLHLKQTSSFLGRFRQGWHRVFNSGEKEVQPSDENGIPDAIIEGIESPYSSGNSIVLIALHDDSSEEDFISTFLDRSQSSDIAHSVSLLRGGQFASYASDATEYHIGDVSTYTRMRIWMTENFWILIFSVTACSLILARWLLGYLKIHAAWRLRYPQAPEPIEYLPIHSAEEVIE